MVSSLNLIFMIVTPPRNRGGVIFSLQFVCVCVSVCLWVSSTCEKNSSRTSEPIWTRFSLNCCLPHWLEPYRNWWPWVKFQGHSDVIPICLYNSLLTSLLCISALLCSIKMKIGRPMSLCRYTLGRFVFKFHKNRIDDDVIVTSFTFSPNNCPYLKFYWTCKLRIWNDYTTT